MAAVLLSSQPKSPLFLTFKPPQKTKKPVAVLNRSHKMRVPYQLNKGQSRLFHNLPSGLSMEVIFQKGLVNDPDEGGKKSSTKPPQVPLVFIHGSFHAAWCWAEHWMPFFSGYGYDCYAISLLGQGESDTPMGPASGTLQTHTTDVADFIRKEVRVPPVLLGHSFGGLIVQSYISNMTSQDLSHKPSSYEKDNSHPTLAGAVLVCSVPPSGNSGLVWRYLLTKPIAAFKVTLSLAAKAFATSLPLCKETFFSAGMEDHLVQSYQELMKESSRMPLFDLKTLNASLPPSVPRNFIEVLVLGATDDFIVDGEGLSETAHFYGVQPVCVEGVAHDMMLDTSWEKGALVILSWLKGLDKQNIY
ncbi:alpha/beta-Hydrolases superfamily protein isoform X2 [Tasmannia lanceolata]|uniref:alpha/beta-Hydrolases superfamily protein isoform X2 n=1 Tax=Tasmannia lanceolata TaxID=3420 RepID=UPI00406493F8